MGSTSSANSKPDQQEFQFRYQIGAKIGEGSYARVHVARRRQDDEMCAVKIIHIDPADHNSKEVVMAEQTAWEAIGKHEHCVALYETFYAKQQCYMVMEKCQSSIMDNLERLTDMKDVDLASIFYQMLSALSHCHEVNVVHRDVKPDNFLLAGENWKTIKLCDFGLAAIQQKGKPLKDLIGTAPYMSPEMVRWKGYDEKTDVWSFGVMVYLILFAQLPYMPSNPSSQNMKQAIRKGVPTISFQRSDTLKHSPSEQAAAFARSLLDRSANTRCSAREALGHSFLGESDGKHSMPDSKKYVALSGNNVPTHFNFSCDCTPSGAIESEVKTSCSAEFLADRVIFTSGSTATGGSETSKQSGTSKRATLQAVSLQPVPCTTCAS